MAQVYSHGGSPQGGTVSFYDGTTLLANVSLSSGTASSRIAILTRGSHSVTAVNSGDSDDSGSTSQALNEMIM